jgi:nucleotide-binding universal stress UspA family protein
MFDIKRVLFPVDFSDHCRGAIGYAEAIAGRFNAELTLLHVMEPAAYNGIADDLRRIETAELEDWFGDDRRYFEIAYAVERGEAARQIARYACTHRSDLILMPTRGLGLYRRLTLGSNTAKVLHDAECPVWTGVHLEDAPPLGEIRFRRILCAVDLLETSSRVLDWANGFAQEYQAELTLAHVTTELETGAVRYLNREYLAALKTRAAEALEELQQSAGLRVATVLPAGDPAKALRETALNLGADLLVIGRSNASGLLGRITKNSYSIVSHSPCPVVSV